MGGGICKIHYLCTQIGGGSAQNSNKFGFLPSTFSIFVKP